jgi:hypothetical protein
MCCTGGPEATDAYAYNIGDNRWWTLPPMYVARIYGSSFIIGNRIYIAGGRALSLVYDSVECYDIHTNTWHLCNWYGSAAQLLRRGRFLLPSYPPSSLSP